MINHRVIPYRDVFHELVSLVTQYSHVFPELLPIGHRRG